MKMSALLTRIISGFSGPFTCHVPISVKYVTNSTNLVDTIIKYRLIEYSRRHSLTSQKTSILSNTAVRTANLTFGIAVMLATFGTIVTN
jgi:hypothetical protein